LGPFHHPTRARLWDGGGLGDLFSIISLFRSVTLSYRIIQDVSINSGKPRGLLVLCSIILAQHLGFISFLWGLQITIVWR